jgi:fatty acid desaturase
MQDRLQGRLRGVAPNYTNATLVMAFVNLLCAFLVLWTAFGLPAVLITGVFLDYLITRLAQHRRRHSKP